MITASDRKRPAGSRRRALWPEAPDPRNPANLPAEFPVFPLARALLLPRGHLPLNVFEPRYLNLVDASLAEGRMFGMVQPARGGGLQRIGCLGRIGSFAETEDGCYLITMVGISRFVVVSELPLREGFRAVCADYAPFDDLAPASTLALDRPALLDALRRYFARRGLDANWDAVERMGDDALVTTLAMVCPFNEAEKQALLEAADQAERAAQLHALLAIGSHEPPGGPLHAS